MKFNELKVALAQQILNSDDEKELRTVEEVLNSDVPFRLNAREKAELDRDLADHKVGKGRNYSWKEVKAYARKRAR